MMVGNIFSVALGGAVGAVLRYGISLLPLRTSFPFLTLGTNILGAVLIGLIVGLSFSGKRISPQHMLFWKTGLCGGFTTFSTFSLEAFQLMEKGQPLIAVAYMLGSVLFCILGVAIGWGLARAL